MFCVPGVANAERVERRMPMNDQERLVEALRGLDPKPPDDAVQAQKRRYSEQMSEKLAQVVADSLRRRGTADLIQARPSPPGVTGASGAERRMAGGIGDKKVDVTWATEEAGLILAFSVKCINFRDRRTRNFQKNFTNRRGDMLFEAVTLHRRFPYSTLVGLFVFDEDAERDATEQRNSTFQNAHHGLRLFTDRIDPAGRAEQYEKFYVGLVSASPAEASIRFSRAGEPEGDLTVDTIFEDVLPIVAERNDDSYRFDGRRLRRA